MGLRAGLAVALQQLFHVTAGILTQLPTGVEYNQANLAVTKHAEL
jgi:hypothetical protein